MKRNFSWAAAAFVGLALLAGCATTTEETTQAPSDDTAAIKAALEQWKLAVEAKNIEQVMSIYSDHFSHPELGDKAGVQSYLTEADSAGYMDGIQVDTAPAKIALNGNQAVAAPIKLSGSFGQIVYELTYTQENGQWLVTGSRSSGM